MSSQTVEIIDFETMETIIRGPMIAVPRNSEQVKLRDMSYVVVMVVYDFQEVKGLTTQANLAIRVYVKRLS